MQSVQLTFTMSPISQGIIDNDLNDIEILIGRPLPIDYRQHMLTINGGIATPKNIEHKDLYGGGGGGIGNFYPIKYGSSIMESIYNKLLSLIPEGYIAIGRCRGGGHILMSVRDDETYGNTKLWFQDGSQYNLSPTFTDLLNDMVIAE
jgi:hypothetical protein